MAKKRSVEKWNNQFLINQKIFESISDLSNLGDDKLVQDACIAYRNPVVFDNQVSDAVFELPYFIPGNEDDSMTKDHLIGMSNIVLYIHKNKINERWQNVDDFVNLKSNAVKKPIDNNNYNNVLENLKDLGII